MMRARSSWLAIMRSYQARSSFERSMAEVFCQEGRASCAASMARRVSAVPQSGTSASVLPVAGLSTVRVL